MDDVVAASVADMTNHVVATSLDPTKRAELLRAISYAAPALAVLDRLTRGVIFVGQDKRSRYTNPAASLIFSEADGLSLDHCGHCRTASASEQRALDRLLAVAIRGRMQPEPHGPLPVSGGAMTVMRPSGRRPYGLVVAPMPSPQFGLNADHIAAAVLITDPESEMAVQRDLLRVLYRLSDKEAQLAIRLSAGERLESAARGLGITYQTARSYLKAVFAKLGVNRQVELASVVRRLEATG